MNDIYLSQRKMAACYDDSAKIFPQQFELLLFLVLFYFWFYKPILSHFTRMHQTLQSIFLNTMHSIRVQLVTFHSQQCPRWSNNHGMECYGICQRSAATHVKMASQQALTNSDPYKMQPTSNQLTLAYNLLHFNSARIDRTRP